MTEKSKSTQTEYDSPWKEALEEYFADCLLLLFPKVHADIDWSKGYAFLDKELQKVTRQSTITERFVDKLARVYRKSGESRWVLIHIDVQSQRERDFAKRMYVYYYRLFDRYDQDVATFAIYADESKKWRPDHYERELWETKLRFDFSTVKLLDYEAADLEASDNPFATVVLAHLRTKATHNQAEARYKMKFRLTRMLYEKEYSKEKILSLYRYIDWIMALPPEMEEKLTAELTVYEEARKMTYVTNAERIGYQRGMQRGMQQGIQQGIQQGMQQGLLRGIGLGLKLKFGVDGLRILSEIDKIEDLSLLNAVHEALPEVETLSELQRIYQTPPAAPADAPAQLHQTAAPYAAKTPPAPLREAEED